MDITVSIPNQTFQEIKKELGVKLNRKEEKQIKADIILVLEGFYGQSVVRDAIESHKRKRSVKGKIQKAYANSSKK